MASTVGVAGSVLPDVECCWWWFGIPDGDMDCRHWLAYMTAAELGWPEGSKLTLDRETGTTLDGADVPTATVYAPDAGFDSVASRANEAA